ncbi:MAG: transcription elongation factor GreA [Paludibacteraceae bacterium]|nr:transcription elongation factor GreA [Paludibacteraceae bacterium]
MAVIYMTAEGLKKLHEELSEMESVQRPAISRAIAEARDKGDLSENAEYDAAREAQGLLEMKIAQLKDKIANVRIIDESRIKTDEVQILTKVRIRNTKNNAQMTYTIVSEGEANFKEGRLSVTTPIAKALLGKKVGDKVEVVVPAGKMEFEILDISI